MATHRNVKYAENDNIGPNDKHDECWRVHGNAAQMIDECAYHGIDPTEASASDFEEYEAYE